MHGRTRIYKYMHTAIYALASPYAPVCDTLHTPARGCKPAQHNGPDYGKAPLPLCNSTPEPHVPVAPARKSNPRHLTHPPEPSNQPEPPRHPKFSDSWPRRFMPPPARYALHNRETGDNISPARYKRGERVAGPPEQAGTLRPPKEQTPRKLSGSRHSCL